MLPSLEFHVNTVRSRYERIQYSLYNTEVESSRAFDHKAWESFDSWMKKLQYSNYLQYAILDIRVSKVCDSSRFDSFMCFFANILIFWNILCSFWISLIFLMHFALNLYKRCLFYYKKTLMQNSRAIYFNPRTDSVNYFSIGIRYTRKLEIHYCAQSVNRSMHWGFSCCACSDRIECSVILKSLLRILYLKKLANIKKTEL